MDKSKPLIISFLDLTKAFDTVNTTTLIGKLETYGIRCKTELMKLELMNSYLFNRKQIVKLEDKRSTEKEIQTGVPQGIILGPLLFILYVNDLLLDMHKNTILSYEDATVVIFGDNTWASAQEKMNKFLNKIANWLALNKLSLNTNKTVYMTVGNYCDSVPRKIEIEIHKQKIKELQITST